MHERGDDWLTEVEDWVVEVAGPKVSLEIIRERAWGVIVRVTTPHRVLFFKEPAAAGRHESVIVADLAKGWPGLAPDVVGAEHERGWLLMEDHGMPMRESLSADEQIAVFEEILPHYAQMQRQSRPFVDRWKAAGAQDRGTGSLPSLVHNLIEGRSRIGSVPLKPGQIDAALRELPAVLDELASAPFATGVDHSDLHHGNVLVGHGTPRIIDWGDSCISHPFASLFVVFQHIVARADEDGRRRAALRLRDVYLDAWTSEASNTELRAAFAHATWLGYPIRALNFVHMMGEADFDQCRGDVAQFLVRWTAMSSLLDDPDELVVAVANQTEY